MRQLLKSQTPQFPLLPPKSGMDAVLETPCVTRGLISRIYNQIINFKDDTLPLSALGRESWLQNLGMSRGRGLLHVSTPRLLVPV